MNTRYLVSLCEDYELIESIIFDPEIYKRISDDFFDKGSYRPERDGVWLRCDRDGHCVGLARVNIISPLDIRVHIHIQTRFRVNCLKIGKAFISYIDKCKNGALKLSTRIPEKYMNVVGFAEKLGFNIDGKDRLSYKKNGVIYDTFLLSYIFGV